MTSDLASDGLWRDLVLGKWAAGCAGSVAPPGRLPFRMTRWRVSGASRSGGHASEACRQDPSRARGHWLAQSRKIHSLFLPAMGAAHFRLRIEIPGPI